jgi:hypothetical protein
VFIAAWLATQLALIATAGRRPGHAFGFRMFSESSEIEVRLLRRVRGAGELVPVEHSQWVARDREGRPHRIHWGYLMGRNGPHVEGPGRAPYGAVAQLAALEAALAWVAAHTPEDAETRQLVADVTVWTNGRPPEQLRLQSPLR